MVAVRTVLVQSLSKKARNTTLIVVFVPNTKPGDHVKVKITRVSNRFASGEVIQ